MNETLLKDLLDKYLTGSITETERTELSAMLEQPEYQAALEGILSEEMQNHRFEGEGHEKILGLIEDHIRSKISRPPGRIYALAGWAAAAAVLILIFSSYFLFFHKTSQPTGTIASGTHIAHDILPGGNKAILTLSNGSQIILDSAANGTLAEQGNTKIVKTDSGKLAYSASGQKSTEVVYNTLTTPRGGQYQVTLPDGTRVWLNAASSIRYPVVFTGNERNISMTGEVYFEVAKDKAKPFHVMVNGMEVEVLGTHFNINAYADEESIKTTLLEGKVNIKAGKRLQILMPGQQAQLSMQNGIRLATAVDLDQVMAWKNGLFNFKDADIETVMRQLARWYDVDVQYAGEQTSRHFNGEIGRSLTLVQVLKGLASTGVHFNIEGKTITMMK